jgi:hypothetical protein
MLKNHSVISEGSRLILFCKDLETVTLGADILENRPMISGTDVLVLSCIGHGTVTFAVQSIETASCMW